MPSAKTIATVAVITMGAMYILNLTASKVPEARKLIRGVSLTAV